MLFHLDLIEKFNQFNNKLRQFIELTKKLIQQNRFQNLYISILSSIISYFLKFCQIFWEINTNQENKHQRSADFTNI
jgi:hypothetical protein